MVSLPLLASFSDIQALVQIRELIDRISPCLRVTSAIQVQRTNDAS
jgi:hypothetical protein